MIAAMPLEVRPAAQETYTVVKGDNLYRISTRFKVRIPDLMRANNLADENSIRVGMKLKIPKAQSSAEAKPAKNSPAKQTPQKQPSAKPKQVANTKNAATKFSWPVKKVVSCKQDGSDGVKAIGLIIRAPSGAGVYSSAKGTVQRVGYMRGYGNFVLVKHSGDYFTVYSYLDKVRVRQGQVLEKGALIGNVDPDNNLVHFQIDKSGKPLNPLNHLPKRS